MKKNHSRKEQKISKLRSKSERKNEKKKQKIFSKLFKKMKLTLFKKQVGFERKIKKKTRAVCVKDLTKKLENTS